MWLAATRQVLSHHDRAGGAVCRDIPSADGLYGRGRCSVAPTLLVFFFFSSRRRHTRSDRDWSSDVCSSDLLATAGGDRPQARAGDRDAGELERPDHVLLPLALAVHALAQVEDEVGPPRHREPAQIVPHWNLANLVPQRGEDGADLVHGLHHAADILGGPVRGSRVVQDDDPHADAAASCRGAACRAPTVVAARSRPVNRRHATRTTSWISSS